MLTGIISLIALADYNPDDLHHSPMVNDSPVLGKTGLLLLDVLMGGLVYPLGYYLGSLSTYPCIIIKTSTRIRIIQVLSSLGCILFISILANVRDFSSLLFDNSSIFESSVFEHGAGGSLGAIFYSGMPFAESWKYIFITWLNEGMVRKCRHKYSIYHGLIFCLYCHIGGYFVVKNPFIKIPNLITKILTREKSSESIDKSQSLDSSVTPDDQIKKKSKKWNFDLLGSKEEDDLLFEDVSLQKNKMR